ncbi:cytochrome d ubiquinol oxidase subunit II [Streptomyces triticirhizae]|uniref:Cytochrome d ubiquinol oxidase subunit II n=1 Tax=Streptomyces triticirhizae TaxID=2483353 RepID=A0A3M2LXS5_9ACTN|nr:cytochrome d ubiquinol oxidase subunit II [Streptomyces triticirhizae]RMI40855.1 cytochrome d ubiquinol oxidase subunit II [Streptomyces triticirhizae]
MEPLAVVPLGCFAVGYFVVGGAGLGVGMLLPLLGRTGAERAALRRDTAPLSRLATRWLAATCCALLGCFPGLVGDLAEQPSALAPLVTGLALRALAGRGVALRGLSRRAVSRRGPGNGALVAGSWLTAAGWGWLLAFVVGGPDAGWGGPPALLSAVCVALLLLTHGVGVAAWRATGMPFQRARTLVGPRGAGPSLALTSATVAALPLLAGSQLPLMERAAAPWALAAALPVLLLALLALAAAQARPARRRQPRD